MSSIHAQYSVSAAERSSWRSATPARQHYGMRARLTAAYSVILGVDLDSSFGSTKGHIWQRRVTRVANHSGAGREDSEICPQVGGYAEK